MLQAMARVRARGGVRERAAALSKRETYGHKYTQSNRELWDEWAVINARSSFYNVQGFKAGRCTLRPIELEALGDVTDKTLLHLQCHFGMDTLSWARRGAHVTGVAFSEQAIALARALSQ
jgi:2-polyprenyl-3-methyl-5-hydroxy-6-metoxy-1,4-benzoquinol methylase